jgi:RNA polymerase sigma-19 factor, ECF subfamily
MSEDDERTTNKGLLGDQVVAQLYEEHAERLRRWFGRLCQYEDKIDDMVHDAFLRIATRLKATDREPVRDPVSLLYFAAGLVLTDQLRRQVKTKSRLESLDSEAPLVDSGLLPDERLYRQESIRVRHAILEALPEEQRRVIQLQVSGLKPAQIAAQLEIPISAVRRRLQLAYRRCQRRLRALGLADDESD